MESKVIVITGASSGIGAALARQRAGAGDTLVLAARRPDKLAAVAAACGSRTLAVPADVTVRADVERLRDAALDAVGRVDVWVNNAGRGINRGVLELTDDELDAMFLVNTKAPLYGMQAILPHFKLRGEGHLINVSTVLTRDFERDDSIRVQRSESGAQRPHLEPANRPVPQPPPHPGVVDSARRRTRGVPGSVARRHPSSIRR